MQRSCHSGLILNGHPNHHYRYGFGQAISLARIKMQPAILQAAGGPNMLLQRNQIIQTIEVIDHPPIPASIDNTLLPGAEPVQIVTWINIV